MKRNATRIPWIILMVAFIILDVYMLFANLGDSYLIQTDEAFHATNAYEMYKNHQWIINTYRGAVDYFNSKPPLVLDLMIICYKIFGVNAFAARFPSAVGGLITIVVILAFLLKDKKFYAAALFPMLFAACTTLFTFHMYRAAEMDSLFNMFFVIAMFSLYLIPERPGFMYLYGLSFGLAFMCKGPHAALIFIIGLLYIPKIKKAFLPVTRPIGSALLAAFIPVCWMIKRYMFDGTKLFESLFGNEVVGRISSSDHGAGEPWFDFVTSHIFVIFAVLLVLTIACSVIMGKRAKDEIIAKTKAFLIENYLFILWSLIPVCFFSAVRSYLTWYTYTAMIALCILTARLAHYFISEVCNQNVVGELAVVALCAVLAIPFIIPTVKYEVYLAGKGGHPVEQLTEDLKSFTEQYGDAYAEVNAYLIPDFLIGVDETHWEPEYVAPAEMYADLTPVDGTIDNFLNDPDSILILDKNRWDEYSQELIGHVILADNSYLIFSNEMY